jgi:hypothetical protein
MVSTVAIDTAFEAIASVFLMAAMIYSYRLYGLTKSAKILALANPRGVFHWFVVAFILLFLSQIFPMLNSLVVAIPYADGIAHLLIIATAFSGVVAMYMALYYYRTAPKREVSGISA